MKALYVLAALTLAGSGIAIAQTTKQPGGNVASVQGPCAQGYAKAAPGGRMQLSDAQMKQIDTDKNGNISKQEFDSACANQLFEDTKKH
jgi:hypothetical protein